jgi:hypothetical protein
MRSDESMIRAGGITGAVNHAIRQSMIRAGGITGAVNHAIRQPTGAEFVNQREYRPDGDDGPPNGLVQSIQVYGGL